MKHSLVLQVTNFSMSDTFSLKSFVSEIKKLDKENCSLKDYKVLLADCRSALYKDYLEGCSAQKIVLNYTSFIDHLIVKAWENSGLNSKDISLLAVGGYGRGELHPYSDIDLLIGCSKKLKTQQLHEIGHFVRLLWDMGLEVGHSVRTVKQSIALAKKDLTVLTTLMESRALFDEQKLTENLLAQLAPSKFWSANKYSRAKIIEQQERHLAFDDTEHNLEPNIKDGPGGLRDIQTIIWVAGRHYGKIDLKILSDKQILSKEESQTLTRCRNFLWKLRLGLHFHSKRKEDRLLFDYQRNLAKDFGYQDNKHNLAVEVLMKRYYRTAKDIRLLNQTLIQYFLEAGEKQLLKPKKVNTRFNSVRGYLEVSDNSVYIKHPPALLETFYILQSQQPQLKGIRANTIRLIRESLNTVGTKIRQYTESKEIFLKILKHPKGQTHALRSMDAYGVLAAFIPSFNKIVGQMQHDLFHVYTVDAHSLFVLRNLRRFCLEKHKEDSQEAYNVMSQVTKRERLYIAALFHDIAKGRGGDHSVLGEKDALRFCNYLNLSKHDSHFIAWLVRHHLLMSWTAQREDISDPQVIKKFAEKMGDQQHLNCLYLFTVADIRATSPKVWTRWKGKLLWDLYIATSRMMSQNLLPSDDVSVRISEAKDVVLRRLSQEISASSVETFWHSIEPEYFLHFGTDAIYWQQQTILAASAIDIPLANIRYNKDLEANQILVYAAEHDALLPIVSGAIDHLHLSIINAQIERLKNGMCLLAFVTTNLNGEAVKENTALSQAKQYINDRLRRGERNLKPKKRIVSRRSKHFPIKTRVSFTQSDAGNLTIMQIIAQDRPGLLYHITSALLENKIHLHTARINTLGERVEDHFFISDRDGIAIEDEKTLKQLKKSILLALDE